MERKKNSLTELLLLALLATTIRPPNSHLLRRPSNGRVSFGSDMFGDLLIEDVYQSQFSPDIFAERHISSKNPLYEAVDTFEYINSLARFQPQVVPSPVNLVAFPTLRAEPVITDSLPTTVFPDDSLIGENSSLDFSLDLVQSTLLDDLEDFEVNDFHPTFSNDSLDTIDSFIRESNESNEFDELNRRLEETLGLSMRDVDLRAQESELFDTKPKDFISDGEDDLYGDIETELKEESPEEVKEEAKESDEVGELIDENLENEDDILSDIGSLFGELDFKALEEEAFGDWMPQATSSAFFTPENSGFYQIGDAAEGCPVYDSAQNQTATGYTTENHFGTVLYSSLTTLSNAQPPATHLTYPAGEEMTYLQNATAGHPHHHLSHQAPGAQECFNCYDEQLGYHQPEAGLPVGYSGNYSTAYSQAHSSQYTTSVDGALSAHYCHSQVAEDCFDKNSDSAVSSMSSERIHTISENEWNETSSNSSRYNADIAISEYSAEQSSKRANGAQKKYHMFGKRPKSSPTENVTAAYRTAEPNYILEYEQQPQTAPYYPYVNADVNSCPENSLQYYQQCVQQNHSYASAPPEVATIPTVISEPQIENIVPQHQPPQPTEEAVVKQQKRKKSTYSKSAVLDSHFNRDERRAQMLNIPILTEDIVNLPIDEFNDRLSKHDLTDLQLSTIRDIRRRGKNKVAAQNCRKRKLDQINYLQTEVVNIVERKSDLIQQINHYSHMKEITKIQHERLYKFLFESSNGSDTALRCLPSTSKSSEQHFEQINDESSSSDGSFNSYSKQQN